MNFLHRNKKVVSARAFTESAYEVLNYEQLLKVNGAGGGSGGSGGGGGPSGPSSSSGSSSSSSGYSSCGGGSTSSSGGSSHPSYQTPTNSNDYHCDIIAYNEAVSNGAQNPGNWDGNNQTVNQIYNNNYSGQGTNNSVQSNTSGYVFYDWDSNGTYDHMEYYSSGSGNNYTVYVTDGISNPTPTTYNSATDSNGHAATGTATFVPIR